jgi:hypothetical protein
MPSKKKQAKGALSAAELANKARHNPYVMRLIEDPKLRQDMMHAVEASKSAYARLHNGKVMHKALLEDKKLRADLQDAVVAIREASTKLSEAAKPPKKKRHLGRRLLLLIAGAALALALSESLRSKVLDTLFGAEEEFQYTPPTGTATTPPATPVTAA